MDHSDTHQRLAAGGGLESSIRKMKIYLVLFDGMLVLGSVFVIATS